MTNHRSLVMMLTAATVLAAALLPASPVAAEPRASGNSEAWLFTAQSASARTHQLEPKAGEDERFRLTLKDVSAITKFSDRPFRDATLISPRALAKNWREWFATSPPNAVLTFQHKGRPSAAPTSIVVSLRSPHYRADMDALTFTAVRIHRLNDPSEAGRGWERATTPKSLKGVSLFIDDAYDCGPGANCAGMNVSGWNLAGDDFHGAIWTQVAAHDANLADINLAGIDGRLADFSGANLQNANLSGADLSGANFEGADLTGANLSNANLTATNLNGTNLSGAISPGAIVHKTLFCDVQSSGNPFVYDPNDAYDYILNAGSISDEHIIGCTFAELWTNSWEDTAEMTGDVADLVLHLLDVLI